MRLERLKQSDDPEIAGPRREDRPRGGVPPHPRADVARPSAGRAALSSRRWRAAAAGGGAPRLRAARRAHAELRRALGGDDHGAALATGRHEVVTEAQVWDALAEIPDPEIPVISLVDLGVVRDIDVDDRRVRVEFTPTFLGCPALEVMRDAMADSIRALGAEPEIQVLLDDSWSTDRITRGGPREAAGVGVRTAVAARGTAHRRSCSCRATLTAVRTAARPRRGSRTSSARHPAGRCATARAASSRSSSSRRSSVGTPDRPAPRHQSWTAQPDRHGRPAQASRR